MLVDELKDRNKLKTISFRIDNVLVDEFRDKCKKHNIKQVDIIVRAMRKALEEIDKLEKEKIKKLMIL